MRNKLIILMMGISLTINAQLKSIDYTDGSQKLNGFAAIPKKALSNKAGILILPAWMGIDEHSKESAEKLQALGYYAFVADIYGVDKRPTNTKEAGQNAGYYKKNISEYHKRIQLALDQLIKQGANLDKIVVIGYCFGGTGAIEAARTNMKVQGVVSFHGGLGRDANREIKEIKPKVLVLHGADDFYVPKEEVEAFQNEMRKANADWQMVYYANSVHAFTHKDAGNDNSKGAAYNEKADKRSWIAFMDFLKEVL
ncbi:dienelactone hydrolase family protein [Flavobacterium capsici]|uniref:Dienelactone hydrolase family protein n=1 Tax=Flavobacterium capsici TaxID=3075618 RepID=A0AA96EU48_9FLAO|nr:MULTISPECIES: dienelactone hydrolase family protein [unclassified Flavobacterium]WNM18276.1 dienelactone hydrolase family protein [Flavobacterium sp. PMR2A8]WNM22327.1 dienelactone hydrolase family protein [Flavobacterium sp. PMTSA4]